MVQIVKTRKRKGRPPKAEALRRHHDDEEEAHDLDLDRRRDLYSGVRRVPDLRRTTRRRSVTYVEDFYDELSEEEDEEEEDEERRRREKKLKLVLANNTKPSCKRVDSVTRIENTRNKSSNCSRVDSASRIGRGGRGRRNGHVSDPEWSSESECDEEEEKPSKKRKVKSEDDDDDDDECSDNGEDDDDDEGRTVRSRDPKKNSKPKPKQSNGVPRSLDSIQPQVKLSGSSKSVPLPDKQRLELILAKLQKKDTYGVYAEPVDPEELPDYHDVIEHPMDFGTIKKKLGKGAYANLEQFEKDVYLICANAMQYNAPETVYFKQAHSIQELARRKFERLRIEFENAVAELKSKETVMPNHIMKKPTKTSSCKTVQQSLGSDFSSGATLATESDICAVPKVTQAGGSEKPSTLDEQVDGNSSLTENKPEKIEEQPSGKRSPPKPGRKSFLIDEDRRATYSMSNQHYVQNDLCTIFEGEHVQLIPVGPNANHSYARSLARFSATLGPVAWGIASRKIEQSLPPGTKFGRGWVGEYESLPTPVIMFETNAVKRPSVALSAKPIKVEQSEAGTKVGAREPVSNHAKKQPSSDLLARSTNDDKSLVRMNVERHKHIANTVPMKENQMQWQPRRCSQNTTESRSQKVSEGSKVSDKNDVQLEAKSSSGLVDSCMLQDPAKERHPTNPTSERNWGFFGSKPIIDPTYKKQNASMSNKSDNVISKPVNLVSACANGFLPPKQPDHNSERTSLKFMEVVSSNRNLVQSRPFKQSETDGVAAGSLPNGKPGIKNNHQANNLTSAVGPNRQAIAAMYFSNENHQQSINDPVQMMRILAQKTQNLQKSINFAATNGQKITSSDASLRRDDSSAASAAAARAWMTLGAGHFKPPDGAGSPKLQMKASSLYNSSRDVPQLVSQNRENPHVSRVQFHPESGKFFPQAFLSQPNHVGDESRFLNSRQMGFPQLVTTDLSKFQARSPWQGLAPHTQPSKATLPPDLNVCFHSPGSPVKQSSGAVVDSQQPDLALQL